MEQNRQTSPSTANPRDDRPSRQLRKTPFEAQKLDRNLDQTTHKRLVLVREKPSGRNTQNVPRHLQRPGVFDNRHTYNLSPVHHHVSDAGSASVRDHSAERGAKPGRRRCRYRRYFGHVYADDTTTNPVRIGPPGHVLRVRMAR